MHQVHLLTFSVVSHRSYIINTEDNKTMAGWTIIVFLVSALYVKAVVQAQLVGDGGTVSGQINPCNSGFHRHGNSCYRYINLEASWPDAWTYCGAMTSHLVSIETADENIYITSLVQDHTTNKTTFEAITAQKIWTDGSNLQGHLAWMGIRLPLTYTAWHTGEPLVTSPDGVFCVMKMVTTWYAGECGHKRRFVCEINIDGLVMPDSGHIDGMVKTGESSTPKTKTQAGNVVG